MKTKLFRPTLVAGVGAVLALSGCSSSDSKTAGANEADLANGKDYVYAVSSDLGSLNPLLAATGVTIDFGQYLYARLLEVPSDGEYQGVLAEKWEGDTKKVTFTLRENLTCSDGETPLVASDIAREINFLSDPKNESALLGQRVTPGTTAVGDDATRTVTVTGGASDAFMVQNIGQIPIVCKTGLDNPELLARGEAGTGAYTISKVAAGDMWTATLRTDFTAGPNGWSAKTAGVPKSVTARFIQNETTAANLLVSRELNRAEVAGLDRERVERAASFSFLRANLPAAVYFNQGAGNPGADPDFRKAAVMALDLNELTKVLGPGAKRATSFLGVVQPYVCLGDSVKGNVPEHDVEGAKALLDQAGWLVGPDGVRVKDGEKAEMSWPYWTEPGQQTASAELAQKQLEEVGIEVDLRAGGGTENAAAMTSGDWGMTQQGWGFSNPQQMVAFFSGKPWSEGGRNFTGNTNAEYVKLAGEAAMVPGPEGCPKWLEAESALIKNVDFVPMALLPLYAFGQGATFSDSPYSIRMTK